MTDTVQTPAANGYPLRRILILIATFAAPFVGYAQMALDWGLSPAEFAADSDDTLRVAGYAFSIWAVIYGWLIVYGVYQALPRTEESRVSRALGWPSFAALVGISLWIVASAADAELMTILLIFGSGLVLIAPLWIGGGFQTESLKRRALIVWPLAMLAGWLTIASFVNLLTVLTGNGQLAGLQPMAWAIGAVAIVTTAALAMTWRTRAWTYPLPIAWGLVGVFVAERAEGDTALAFSALAAAFIVAIGATLILARKRNVSPAAS